jgi:tetratricopeptide (TPR) repeat protein
MVLSRLFVRTFLFGRHAQEVFQGRFLGMVEVMRLPNLLKIVLHLLLAAVCHAQDTAPLNPANMNKTGMLPPHTKVLGERAVAAFAKKDWAAARKAYQEMLDLDDGNALVWANLGAVEQQAGNVKRAIECFEKSVQFNPGLASRGRRWGFCCKRRETPTRRFLASRGRFTRSPMTPGRTTIWPSHSRDLAGPMRRRRSCKKRSI